MKNGRKVNFRDGLSPFLALLLTPSLALSLVLGGSIPASAASDPYLSAQPKLSYSLYKPVNTLGLTQTKFQSLVCGGGGPKWTYVSFGTGAKRIEIMQTLTGAHCSNPGLSVRMPAITINGTPASVHIYCDPTKPGASKNCTIADLTKVGGYLTFTLPGYYKMKATDLQVQGLGGVTYSQLIAVARSLTPASTRASN